MEEDKDLIEELHKIRRELYAKAGGTPEAYVRYLRSRQEARQKAVAGKAQKTTPPGKAAKRRKAVAQ